MALRQIGVGGLTRTPREERAPRRSARGAMTYRTSPAPATEVQMPQAQRAPQVRSVPRTQAKTQRGEQEGALQLRLHKRLLLSAALMLPLSAAVVGFSGLGLKLPNPPGVLSEAAQRGRILALDGTVLAEGDAEARRYPEGRLAAQLVGFSGAEQPAGNFGLEGLELTLDARLQAGEDVHLTLDPDLQAIAQGELARAAREHGAENGAMVLLEAGSGRVLAAASYPQFDPNTHRTLRDRSGVSNRAFLQQVEPGSVMKPFVIAALMQAGRLGAGEVLEVEPTMQVGTQLFRDVAPHDPRLSVADILRYSSNVGMIKLGERFSSEELAAWFQHFGFGEDVGLKHLYTQTGQINDPATWVPQDHASATIGQSLSATALQLAAAYSIFANGGVFVPPQVVESEVRYEEGVRVGAERLLSPDVAETIKEMLVYTVDHGSLAASKIPGVSVAGKSGSADLYDTEKGAYIDAGTLTFAGIFPADNPKVTAVVYLQRVDPNRGSLSALVAAPVFRRVGSEALALWGMPDLSPAPEPALAAAPEGAASTPAAGLQRTR